MITTSLYMEQVDGNTREALIAALASIGNADNDFNGENGFAHLWEATWRANGFNNLKEWEAKGCPALKYDSNCAYLCDAVKEETDDMNCIRVFFESWLNHDSYYDAYDWNVLKDDQGNVTVVALSYAHR